MLAHTLKSILFAFFYGLISYSLWFCVGMLAWDLYPDASYAAHTRSQKITGWLVTVVAAFLAARAYRPNARWSIVTAIATAQVVQLLAAGVFILRFSREEYVASYVFWPTFFTTIAVGWLTGLTAAFKHLSPRHDAV